MSSKTPKRNNKPPEHQNVMKTPTKRKRRIEDDHEEYKKDVFVTPTKDRMIPSRLNKSVYSSVLFHSNRLKTNNVNSKKFIRQPLQTSFTNKDIISDRLRHSKVPIKQYQLDDIMDDYYLNVLDWSSKGLIGIGLTNNLYILDPANDLNYKFYSCEDDHITGMKYNPSGSLIGIGTHLGKLAYKDLTTGISVNATPVADLTQRIGCMDWKSDNVMAVGCRDKNVYIYDLNSNTPIHKLDKHKQEICGLAFNSTGTCIASGGNDNVFMVWDLRHTTQPIGIHEHNAAVKAVSWSPHKPGILATGGGTADKCLKIWDTTSNTLLVNVDTSSQICNILWSKNSSEICSTHGYSQNMIHVWKYTDDANESISNFGLFEQSSVSLKQLFAFQAHTSRVLYAALGPDNETVCTAAADMHLKCWKVFQHQRNLNPTRLMR